MARTGRYRSTDLQCATIVWVEQPQHPLKRLLKTSVFLETGNDWDITTVERERCATGVSRVGRPQVIPIFFGARVPSQPSTSIQQFHSKSAPMWSIIIYDHLWSSMIIYDHLWSSMIIYDHLWSSMIIYDHLWSSMIIHDFLLLSITIFNHLWKPSIII